MKQILALSLLPHVGPKTIRRLLERFGTAEQVMSLGAEELVSAGLPLSVARQIHVPEAIARAESVLDHCAHAGVRVLTCDEADFPQAFAECADAPCVLYVRGDIDFNSGHWLSVVGTRKASSTGITATGMVVRDVAMLFPDAVIVSGLAFGIDKAAHAAALQYRIKTVAIMAGWVDDIVPQSHYYLARQILSAGGAIVSDRPPGSTIDKASFLSRNRLVAGISEATVVVESATRGGSLVTADIAASYGKELFALPGPIGVPMNEGTNMLIRSSKAIMYQSAEDLADTLGWQRSAPKPMVPGELSPRLRQAYEAMPNGERLDAEQLAERWGVPLWEASSLVGQLRAKGLVAVDVYRCFYKV